MPMVEEKKGFSDSSPAPSTYQDGDNTKTATKRKSKALAILVAIAVAIVILALALGLGLGLGLRHSHSSTKQTTSPGQSPSQNQTNTTTPSPSPPSFASQDVQSWRKSTDDYLLDLQSWIFDAAPTTRTYNFTMTEIDLPVDGVTRRILAVNGQFPGPLIRANRGDRIVVHVDNQMTNATSLHWHGMFQNGTNYMDGTVGVTQCPIAPGSSFTYNFTVDNQYGTYWWHSHFSTQYTDGIVGPLVIHAPEEKQAQQAYDFDQIVLIQDWYHDLSGALLPGYLGPDNENNEPVPDNGLIQGTNYFNCSTLDSDSGYDCQQGNSTRALFSVQPGKSYRLRLINTGAFALFEFSIDNHTMNVIEADGTATQNYELHRLEIGVAQRYSVVVNMNQTIGNYWVRAQMNTFCFAYNNDYLNPDVMALLTYSNSTASPTESVDWVDALDIDCIGLNSTQLVPIATLAAPPATTIYPIQTSFQEGAYQLDRAYINGTSWIAPTVPTLNQAVAGLEAGNTNFSTTGVSSAFSSNQFIIDVPSFDVVDLLITNFDDGSHPFHLHGHQFWVIASSPDQYFDWSQYATLSTEITNPMRRDTVVVDAYGWTLIRFKADNPGLWAFHCHISWHMEAGLLMQFQTRNDILSTMTIPSDVLGLCPKS